MAGFSLIVIFLLVGFIVMLPFLIIYTIGLWSTFKKAGKKGWYSIIPFYNTWILTEIAELEWWYALIVIISKLALSEDGYVSGIFTLAGMVANFFICYNLSKKFNKGIGTALLIFFLPGIMYPIIGFSSSFIYDKNIVVNKNGPIGDNYNNNKMHSSNDANNFHDGNYTEKHYCRFCGYTINNDAKFCGNCGNKIDN